MKKKKHPQKKYYMVLWCITYSRTSSYIYIYIFFFLNLRVQLNPNNNNNNKKEIKTNGRQATFTFRLRQPKKRSKRKMWAILSKYFYPLFTFIFSPIWRDCVLEGGEKTCESHQNFLFFSPLTKQPKISFSLNFFLLYFPSSLKSLQPNIP